MRGNGNRFLTRQWLGTHALVLFAVFAFLALGWWQASRAGDGNMRSYGYALQWPTFAIIVIFLWIRAMRTELRTPPVDPNMPGAFDAAQTQPSVEPITDENDPELAAYNRYLADLNRQDAHSRR